jgi:N-acyl-L-homoserine lactone synthetase
MVRVLYGHQRSKHIEEFKELFRLRYQVFIQGRNWSLPSTNGLEIDQYDKEDAVYFVDYNDNGQIQGSVRLTPTANASLLADYFPHLVEQDTPPRSAQIYEATRYIVLPPQKSREANRAAKAALLGGMVEWCLGRKLSFVQTVIDSSALSSFVEITGKTIPLGLSHPFGGGRGVSGGGECMAIRWPVTEDLLEDIRAYGAVSSLAAA